MNNLKLLNKIKSKLEKTREEINELSLKVGKDENFWLVFDMISTELESDLCNALNTVETCIEDIEDSFVEVK
jgi:hypothetical protein